MSDSKIKKFFENQTVFITGGTGFLGKVLLEKLIRKCDVRKIYVLIRPKKSKTTQERMNTFFTTYPCFDRIKKEKPNFEEIVTFVNGNCEEINLGLSSKSEEMLIKETNVVIHAAANVKFDQSLREAINVNVRGTRDLLEMAHKMHLLKAFVYVSTAYSNCLHSHIGEKFYEPPMTAKQIINILDEIDDTILERIAKPLIDPWPNTYTFSKTIAEDLIKTKGYNLPVVVVRPAIVSPTLEEPMPGWIDNFYGLGGIGAGAALGVIRSLNAKLDNNAAIVPCDYVANTVLASAWYIAEEKQVSVPIYNYVGSKKNLVSWGNVIEALEGCAWDYPTEKIIWYYTMKIRENTTWHKICVFFQHTVLAYIVDFLLLCLGKKPIAVDAYARIDKLLDLTSYFTMNYWTFDNNNVEKLWEKMVDSDRKLFSFNLEHTDLKVATRISLVGGRTYLLKDPLETVPRGQKKVRILTVAHYSLLAIFYFLLFLLVKWIVKIFLI